MSDKRIGGRPRGQKTIVSNEQVYVVILDRYTENPPRPTSKNDVMKALNATWQQVDGHFDRLIARDRIKGVAAGFFIPTNVFQDRSVSLTTVPGGRHKLEIGEHVVELSPRELSDLVALGFGLVRR